jgi:hypothetical protein
MSAPGWIKVHRALLDHWCATEPEALAVWVRMLCEANFEDKKANIYGQLVDVRRGQLVYGRKEFSKRSGVAEMKLRRIVSMLESDGMIIQQKKSKFTLISIACYDDYQDANQQTTSKQPANNQQVTTPKEVKNLRSKETDITSPDGDQKQQSKKAVFRMMAEKYMELIPEMPAVDIEANANGRETKAANFYAKHKFTNERWAAYLMAVRECSWMFEDRPSFDGKVWKKKNFDFLITEKCYLGVKEDRYGTS